MGLAQVIQSNQPGTSDSVYEILIGLAQSRKNAVFRTIFQFQTFEDQHSLQILQQINDSTDGALFEIATQYIAAVRPLSARAVTIVTLMIW